MIEIDVERLRSVGLTPAQAAALFQLSTPPMDTGGVATVHRSDDRPEVRFTSVR